MKCISAGQANEYLSQIGMTIGSWNRIEPTNASSNNDNFWLNYRAPELSRQLMKFSLFVADWLPKGENGQWKIFQIEDSTGLLNPVETSVIGRILLGSKDIPDLYFVENRTFLFEFGDNDRDNANMEMLIAYLIYFFLVFEQHAYLCSSNSKSGQLLHINDGFIYFSSNEKNVSGAGDLLKVYEQGLQPEWVQDLIVKNQELYLNA